MKRFIANFKPRKKPPPEPLPITNSIECPLPPHTVPVKKRKKVVVAFPQFPTEVFQTIIDIYIQDCRLNADLRGIYRMMITSRTMHSRLGPHLFRFVTLENFDHLTSFNQSLWTARRYTKAIDISCVVPPTSIQLILDSLQGTLERLCLAVEQSILSWIPVLVPDLTLFYNEYTRPGNLRCRRLRLTLTELDISYQATPHISRLPFNDISWFMLLGGVTSFAFELSSDDIDTLSTVYDIIDGLHFTSLQKVVVIIYFHAQPQLDEFRKHGKSLGYNLCVLPKRRHLHVVYLLLEEHEQWTFRSLECRKEDFWEKIKTRFEFL